MPDVTNIEQWPELTMPFGQAILNIPMSADQEIMGVQVFIHLAQSLDILGQYADRPQVLLAEEAEKFGLILSHALTWMDSIGFKDRHPDLADMPTKVRPLDFKGGDYSRLCEWMSGELEKQIEVALERLNHLDN